MSENSELEYEGVLALIEMRRLSAAREKLAILLQSNPENIQFLVTYAEIKRALKECDEALELVQKALLMDPDHPFGRHTLFCIHRDLKQLADAELVIIDLLRDFPEDADYYADYSNLMFDTLNLEKADNLVNEALRLDSENVDARINKLFLDIALGRKSNAEQEVQQLFYEYPDRLETTLALVVLLLEKNRFQEAQRISQELLTAYPDDNNIVELVIECRVLTHPLGLPNRYFHRWGWYASAGTWIVAVVSLRSLRGNVSDMTILALSVSYILFCIYTWVYPPLMRRWLKRFGL